MRTENLASEQCLCSSVFVHTSKNSVCAVPGIPPSISISYSGTLRVLPPPQTAPQLSLPFFLYVTLEMLLKATLTHSPPPSTVGLGAPGTN